MNARSERVELPQLRERLVLIATLLVSCAVFLAAESRAAPVDSFGDATIFKSANDLDPVGLAGVTPAADHLFIGGDGIDNGDFTLQTDVAAGVQLGLRAGERFLANALPNDGAGTYFAEPGPSPMGPSDPPLSERATWNYYIHVDLGANLASLVPSGDVNAPGPLTPLGAVDTVLLSVDFDPGVIATDFVVIDVYAQAIALGGATAPLLVQDSQNLAFDFWSLLGAPPFDVHADGVYTIRLEALAGAATVAETEIDVVVGNPSELLVSFGVEGSKPTTESIGSSKAEPRDIVAVDRLSILLRMLPPGEDLDALHFFPDGRYMFSTTTSATVDGVTYGPGDIVEFDGSGFSLFFDETLIDATAKNVDAFSLLPNGSFLVSTALDGEIYGFPFTDGDVVEVDPVAESASLFMGLSEASIFTGANQDIDGLHYDADSGTLLLSVRTAGGGTVGGFAYSSQAADAFALDLSSGAAGSLYFDGTGFYNGTTRQLDALWVPEPGALGSLAAGGALLTLLARRRGRD